MYILAGLVAVFFLSKGLLPFYGARITVKVVSTVAFGLISAILLYSNTGNGGSGWGILLGLLLMSPCVLIIRNMMRGEYL